MSGAEENLILRTILAEILHVHFYDMDEHETVDRLIAGGVRGFKVLDLPVLASVKLAARLEAFTRDCTLNGDMTPTAARMLRQILEETK